VHSAVLADCSAATGNNLVISGDLTRRAILCTIDPKMERPETRVFDRDPIAEAKARRGELVVAALTILRAFHVAGRPGKPDPLGSFEAWSDLVRGALLWMGAADPVASMIELRESDPILEATRAVMSQWRAAIGAESVTSAEIIGRAIDLRPGGHEFVHADFREGLMRVAGKGGGLNSRMLGAWLMERKDRIVDGFRFVKMGTRQGAVLWAVQSAP
jgi:putative DNA primase/helicase